MRNPFKRQPRPVPQAAPEPAGPVEPLAPEAEAELREQARTMVWAGFVERDDAYYMLADWYDGQGVPQAQLEAEARRIVDEEWATRTAELADGDLGDYGPLAAAFDALADRGVVARMNFACCQNCGTTEIDDERTPATPAQGSTYAWQEWGYTFFHQQDTERLADGDQPLFLSFSAWRPAPGADPADVAAGRAGDAEAQARVVAFTDATVGSMVRDALEEQGLQVTWGGTHTERLQVAVPRWRKPLPA